MELKTRRQAIAAYAATKEAHRAGKYAQPGVLGGSPCDGCPNVERCAQGLACEAMALFVKCGRVSPTAARQPSAAIFRELFA